MVFKKARIFTEKHFLIFVISTFSNSLKIGIFPYCEIEKKQQKLVFEEYYFITFRSNHNSQKGVACFKK